MAKAVKQERSADLKPLKVTCTSSNCDENLHCFKATRQMNAADTVGACRSCGASLVDWARVHRKNLADVGYTFDSLKYEMIRHHFWHVDIDPKAITYARKKGLIGLRQAIRARLTSSIGAAKPGFDGRQTPMAGSGNPIHYAQHATACCCRKCVEYWHGIPQGRELAPDEIEYFCRLAMLYIQDRLPGLQEIGEAKLTLGTQKKDPA